MDYNKTAQSVLDHVGGADNVTSLVHCMTRLRFTLKDESLADDEAVKKTKGVMGLMKKGGQYQVIIGNDVAYVYKELCAMGNFANQKPVQNKKSEGNLFSRLMDTISGIMGPVIPAIIGSAMIKVLLALLPMIGIVSTKGETYQLLSVMGDGAFYFMPVLIAISAAKKFETNTYYAATLALIMQHPNFTTMLSNASEASQTIHFLGVIPVTYANYAYSVIPIILSVWMLQYVEKLVDKITPVLTKNFLKPLLVILIAAPIALIVLGPLGAICGDYLAKAVYFVHDKLGFLAVGIIAGVYPFVVMTGMHHAFTPIKLATIASTGFENFICIGELCSNMGQGAAAAAVAVKTKNKDFRQIAGSSAFSGLLAGITEPALYGVTLRLKRPMLGACIGACAGGLFGGFMQLKCYGIATPAIVTIVQYVSPGKGITLLYAAVAIAITVVVSFAATLIFGFEDVVDEDAEETEASPEKIAVNNGEVKHIQSPVTGTMLKLSEVNDKTFAEEVLGKSVAVMPTEGKIYAPFNGTVETLFDTKHAIGLCSEDGVELLIHVGIDTVNLNGKYFTAYKNSGDHVETGELLLEFNMDGIQKEGYELTTVVVVTNSDELVEFIPTEKEKITSGEVLLKLV